MKTTLICLCIALLHFILTAQDVVLNGAGSPSSRSPKRPPNLILAGGVSGAWLTVCHADNAERGFDPSFTYLLSDPKPIVKKLPSGKYEITFVSEIAQDLP